MTSKNSSTKKATATEIKTLKVPQQHVKASNPATSYQNGVGSTHISTLPLPPQAPKPPSSDESRGKQNEK